MLAHMTAHMEQRGCRLETHHQATKPLCTPTPLHTPHTCTPAHHAALRPSWRRALQASGTETRQDKGHGSRTTTSISNSNSRYWYKTGGCYVLQVASCCLAGRHVML
jgi:hypothetical protein